MNFTDLNPAGEIGANCQLVEIGPWRFIIDCGINPKHVGLAALPNLKAVQDAGGIDFIILTHCHLDHLGAIPLALKQNPHCEIICSQPTAVIAPRMLRNSLNVMKRQRDELGIPEYPLYHHGNIDAVENAFAPQPFGKPRVFHKEGKELTLTLHASGHAPGACGLLFEHKRRKIFFTADVLFRNMNILPGAQFPKFSPGELDALVMETTRGATAREVGKDAPSEEARLVDTIAHTLKRGGNVVLPVFALGRCQEVLSILHKARAAGKLPKKTPLYATGLGMAMVDYLDVVAKRIGGINFRKKILTEMGVQSFPRHIKPGSKLKGPGIYVLSSGMLVEQTPSYLAAACVLEDPKSAVCFVGYCDPSTPGGVLLETPSGEPFVFEAYDKVARVNATVERFDLSGHADREELLAFATQCSPRAIVLSHGDADARNWFANEFALHPQTERTKVIDPTPEETYSV